MGNKHPQKRELYDAHLCKTTFPAHNKTMMIIEHLTKPNTASIEKLPVANIGATSTHKLDVENDYYYTTEYTETNIMVIHILNNSFIARILTNYAGLQTVYESGSTLESLSLNEAFCESHNKTEKYRIMAKSPRSFDYADDSEMSQWA
ncbi:unnamed protein product [Amaranthus hypochondriacus]